jgi:O-antigen/teichoic acid export membrane protein
MLRVLMTIMTLSILIFGSLYLVSDGAMRIVILIVATAKAVEAMSDILYGYFQLRGFGGRVGISMLLKALFVVFTAGLALNYRSNASSLSLALLVAWLSLLILYDLPNAVKLGHGSTTQPGYRIKKHFHQAKLLLTKTLPLAFVALICSVTTNLPRYFLESIAGTRDLGLYAAMAYLGIGLTLIAAGVGHAILPSLGRAWDPGSVGVFRSRYYQLLRIATVIGTGGIIFSLFLGKAILGIVYGAEYQEQSHVFVLIMIAAGLNMIGLYQWYTMTAMRMLRHQLILSSAVLLTLTALCSILVSRLGLAGAALAEILCALFQVCIGGWLITNKFRQIHMVKTAGTQ